MDHSTSFDGLLGPPVLSVGVNITSSSVSVSSGSHITTINYQLLISKVSLVIFTTVVNVYALICVCKTGLQRSVPTCLLKNFLVSSILVSVLVGGFCIMEDLLLVKVEGMLFCGLSSGIKRLSSSILPVNMLTISYEQIRPRPWLLGNNERKDAKWSPRYLVLITWAIAILISLPAPFNYISLSPPPNPDAAGIGGCNKLGILNSNTLRSIYDVTFAILVQIFPSTYMIYGWKSRVHQLRLVFFYTVSYFLVWTPSGMLLIYMEVYGFRKKDRKSAPSLPLIEFIYLFIASYITLHPLLYLISYHNLKFDNLINSCLRLCFIRSVDKQDGIRNGGLNTIEASFQMETYHRSKSRSCSE